MGIATEDVVCQVVAQVVELAFVDGIIGIHTGTDATQGVATEVDIAIFDADDATCGVTDADAVGAISRIVALCIFNLGTGGVQDGFVALSIVGGDAVDVDVCGQGKRQAGTSGIDVDVAIGVHKAYGLTGGHVKGIAGGVGGVPTQVHFAGKGAVQGFQLRYVHAIGIG